MNQIFQQDSQRYPRHPRAQNICRNGLQPSNQGSHPLRSNRSRNGAQHMNSRQRLPRIDTSRNETVYFNSKSRLMALKILHPQDSARRRLQHIDLQNYMKGNKPFGKLGIVFLFLYLRENWLSIPLFRRMRTQLLQYLNDRAIVASTMAEQQREKSIAIISAFYRFVKRYFYDPEQFILIDQVRSIYASFYDSPIQKKEFLEDLQKLWNLQDVFFKNNLDLYLQNGYAKLCKLQNVFSGINRDLYLQDGYQKY